MMEITHFAQAAQLNTFRRAISIKINNLIFSPFMNGLTCRRLEFDMELNIATQRPYLLTHWRSRQGMKISKRHPITARFHLSLSNVRQATTKHFCKQQTASFSCPIHFAARVEHSAHRRHSNTIWSTICIVYVLQFILQPDIIAS